MGDRSVRSGEDVANLSRWAHPLMVGQLCTKNQDLGDVLGKGKMQDVLDKRIVDFDGR